MVISRYPQNLPPEINTTGFMTRDESIKYWRNEDFAPLLDTKTIQDPTGNLKEYEYRFTPRRPVRTGSKSMAFTMRGPLGPLSYEYKPLKNAQKQIRIVTLLPGQGLEPIRCTTSTHDFPSGTGKYTCLSYVWGSPKGIHPMYLDSGIIGLTNNLMAAIWHIRHKKKPIRLWIDALCINQEDDKEKADQVQMMRNIYKNADRLISWLGVAQSDPTPILRDLNRPFQAGLNCQDNDPPFRSLVKTLTEVNWVNLRPIFDSAYWSRAWIIQEVAVREEIHALRSLAQDDIDQSQYGRARRNAQWPKIKGRTRNYLLYGHSRISLWSILVITVGLLHNTIDGDILSLRHAMGAVGDFNGDVFGRPQDKMSSTCLLSSFNLISQLVYCLDIDMDFCTAYLHSCMFLQVKVDRDRLFSLAGLYEDLKIEVDYEKPDTEVVLDVAEKCVESFRTYQKAQSITTGRNDALHPSLTGNLPAADTLLSWIPYGKTILLLPEVYPDFCMDRDTPYFIGTRNDTSENTRFVRGPGWGKLYMQCMYRTTIFKLFQDYADTEFRSAMAARFGGCEVDNVDKERLLRWLTFTPPTPQDKNLLEQYLNIDKYDSSKIDLSIIQVFDDMLKGGHKYGLLSDGNIFVSFSYTHIGDEIIIAEGCRDALVVRKQNARGEVIFVEEALLVGIHHSQVITEWREEVVMI